VCGWGCEDDEEEPPSAKLLYGICCGVAEYAPEYEYGPGAGYGV
jgi:hypothetical protein